ncbi:MAG: sulfite exporter TauE/SafE family protein [bacterium]
MDQSILGSIFLLGLSAGFMSGILGVGGGTIFVPGLVLLLGVTQHVAQGVSLAVMVPTASLGAYAYYKKGRVDIGSGKFIIIGSVIGVFLGGYIASLIPAVYLTKFFAVFLIFVGVKMGIGR